MAGFDYCFTHNPEAREDKKLAILKGGLAPKKSERQLEPVKVRSVEDILVLIEDTINRIRSEPMTHQKANAIGYLSNVALRVFEVGEIDDKLELINSLILQRKGKVKR
jgi:hypothetical protein